MPATFQIYSTVSIVSSEPLLTYSLDDPYSLDPYSLDPYSLLTPHPSPYARLLYWLFATTCGAGLLTSSWALTFFSPAVSA